MKSLSIIFCVLLIFTGCVTTQKVIQPKALPNESKAYVTGRFLLSYAEWAPRMAVALKNQNGKEIYIELERQKKYRDITIVELDPGNYEIIDVVKFSGAGDGIMERVPFADLSRDRSFVLRAGEVLYIGSYDGRSFHKIDSFIVSPFYTSVSVSGTADFSLSFEVLSNIEDSLRREYPEFSSLKLIELPLLSE